MTLVVTANIAGQTRGEPVRLPDRRRRRLSTIVARHKPAPGRRFIVSVHRKGETFLRPTDGSVRLRANWRRTLVGPDDVVLVTEVPLGRGIASIGLAIASIALIAVAPYAAPALAGALGGAGIAVSAGVVQTGLVIGGVALGYAAQASAAAKKKTERSLYSVTGGGNVPKPGARKPLLYGRCWTTPPLSQKDFFAYDGDMMVLTKRMTLGIGRFHIHAVHVGEAVFWTEGGGIQAPFTSTAGPLGTAIEFLYGQPSTIAPGDVISSPSVVGQEMPRPGGNPEWTPWFRLTPQGVTADAAQMSWTYPAIYRVSSQGRQTPTVAGVIFQGQEIDPNTGEAVGPIIELWRSSEGATALTTTPLRRSAYFRLLKSGAYQVRAQNMYPEAVGFEQKNTASWDEMAAIEDDVRIRPNTTEIVMRVRAGKGLTVTAFSEIWVDATRIVPVWNGAAWIEQPERKAVWAFADLVRSQHGLALPNGFDQPKASYYHELLDANDTFDGALPEVSSFWEAASEVLLPLRADPVKVGPVHSFVRDESRAEPRHVLSRRQIVRDSGGATYKTKVEGGDVIVEFDRDGDPRRPDEVRFSYGPATRTPKRYRVNGIRDGLHALKHATWLAAVAVFRGAERRITTEWDGRLVFPGDHVLSDLWFFKGKQAFGVASVSGNVLTLDVTANVPAKWGYGSVRQRDGREWGILRMRGIGARGLELHPDDVTALVAQTGRSLADVLAQDSQSPTTIVIGDLTEIQETYVARSAIPSDADHVQIEMVRDDPRVWQLLDEQVIAPAPINADNLAEPLIPQISVLHARCERIETGIEVVWGVSVTRGARNYEADISYDAGGSWEPLSPYGPASSGRAQMRQSDQPVTVRARAFGRTGLPGDYVSTTFTTVAPIVQGELVDITTLPPIDYAGLTKDVQDRIAYALEVMAYAQGVGAKATEDFTAASARADDIAAKATADFLAADTKAQDALDRAILSLGNDTANAAAITSERTERLTAGEAFTSRLDTQVARIDGNTAAIVTEQTTRANADGAISTRLDAVVVQANTDRAAFVAEQTIRITNDEIYAGNISALIAQSSSASAAILAEQTARVSADDAQAAEISGLRTRVGGAEASVIAERQARSDADGAQASRINSVITQANTDRAAFVSEQAVRITNDETVAGNISALIGQSEAAAAAILSEQTARISADSAQATAIDGLKTRVGTVEASVVTERQARVDGDSAQASRIDAVITQANTDRASFISEQTVRITNDNTFAGNISALIGQSGAASAAILAEQTARVDADSALGQRIDSVVTTANNDRAFVLAEQTARVNFDNSLASQLLAVSTYTNNGTASGRMILQANSGPAGVDARFELLLALQAGGFARGTGFSMDLLSNGGSLVRFDADRFVITAPGSNGVPVFSVDTATGTLSVPYLRLTSGQASIPLRVDIGSYTLIAGQGTVNDQIDANLNFTFNVSNPDFPSTLELFGKVTVTGPQGTELRGIRLLLDGQIVGYVRFNEQITTPVVSGPANNTFDFRCSCIRFLPVGAHRVQIQYSYTSPGAGQVQINELHLAGFQPKA
ncbi:UNVERIFIED_CONTAM: host specificity factor TipJ family phage tail protein [Methylobacteriaceae bacterium AG10]|nr:host specificity factor TipJ family phage tail protein [Methylobacteriaceae bacterium AG10]